MCFPKRFTQIIIIYFIKRLQQVSIVKPSPSIPQIHRSRNLLFSINNPTPFSPQIPVEFKIVGAESAWSFFSSPPSPPPLPVSIAGNRETTRWHVESSSTDRKSGKGRVSFRSIDCRSCRAPLTWIIIGDSSKKRRRRARARERERETPESSGFDSHPSSSKRGTVVARRFSYSIRAIFALLASVGDIPFIIIHRRR